MSSRLQDSDNSLLLTPCRILFNNKAAVYCSVSANSHGDVFIAYHKSFTADAVGYTVGRLTTGLRLLMEDHENLESSGAYPKTAINDNKIVLVVFTKFPAIVWKSPKVRCTMGVLQEDGKQVVWNVPTKVCKGKYPDIAIIGNNILLVFSKSKDLLYTTGLLDESSRQITWGPETKIDGNACYPSVAMTEDAFIVVYQDYSNYRLKSVCGKIQQEDAQRPCKLICGIAQDHPDEKQHGKYCTGENPSIALFNDHTFVVTHQTGSAAARSIKIRIGEISLEERVAKWHQEEAEHVQLGSLTSLAAVNGQEKAFIEVHSTNTLGGTATFYEAGCTKNI